MQDPFWESLEPMPGCGVLGLTDDHLVLLGMGTPPSTGRGKKLTLAQENVLKRLYQQKLPSVPDGELPAKGFWAGAVIDYYIAEFGPTG
jgi:hypothetical protein